jgi:hypothetical protein
MSVDKNCRKFISHFGMASGAGHIELIALKRLIKVTTRASLPRNIFKLV